MFQIVRTCNRFAGGLPARASWTQHSEVHGQGTWGGGLTRLSEGGLVEETLRTPVIGADAIWNLAEGPEGTLWLGYYNYGVGWMKDGKVDATALPGSNAPRFNQRRREAATPISSAINSVYRATRALWPLVYGLFESTT